MTRFEIVEEVKKLSKAEQLAAYEEIGILVREETDETTPPKESKEERDRKRRAAAEALLNDYLYDEELTAFTALDGEKVYD